MKSAHRLHGDATPSVAPGMPIMRQLFHYDLRSSSRGVVGIAGSNPKPGDLVGYEWGAADPVLVLNEFLALDGRPDEAFVEFAQWHGMLWNCRHDDRPDPKCLSCTKLRLPDQSLGERWEPIALWRAHLAKYKAVVTLAAAIASDHPGSKVDWKVLLGSDRPPGTAEVRRDALAVYANQCLNNPYTSLTILPASDGFELQVQAVGLRAQLALALAAVLRGYVYMCAYCKRPFTPDRKPKAGRLAYCPPVAGRPQSENCRYQARLERNRRRWARDHPSQRQSHYRRGNAQAESVETADRNSNRSRRGVATVELVDLRTLRPHPMQKFWDVPQ